MTKFKVLTDRLNTFFTNNKITTGNSIPTSGEWNVGDICISSIQENGECGWICTESGTPGKWEIFGSGGSGKLVSLSSSVEVTGPVTEVSLTGLGTNVSENDKLFVHYNSTHLLEGVDFEIISNGTKIRKLGGGSWNESSSNAMFAFELLKHVKKVNGDNILLDSKMCVLKSNKTISAPASEVEIGIEGFNKDSDYLTVYVNSTYLTEGVDYNISSDGRKILSLNGNWNEESLSDYRFSFVVIKEVGIVNPEAVVGTENLKDGSVTMGKLGEDVTERLDGFDLQLEHVENDFIDIDFYKNESDNYTEVFRQCFEDCKSQGKNIRINKMYRVTDTLILDGFNGVIYGSGGIILDSLENLTVLKITNSQIKCRDIKLTSTYRGKMHGLTMHGLWLERCVNSTVDNVEVSYRTDGIRVDLCKNVIVNNCIVHDLGEEGIACTDSANIIIENNKIYDHSGDGILFKQRTLMSETNNIIKGNIIYNGTYEYSHNQSIYGGGITSNDEFTITDHGVKLSNIVIDGNIIYDTLYGITLSNMSDVSIINNNINNVDKHGISIDSENENNPFDRGLYNYSVSNNIVKNVTNGNGISFTTLSHLVKNAMISNNRVENIMSQNGDYSGIVANDSIISSNIVTNCKILLSATDCIVTSNKFEDTFYSNYQNSNFSIKINRRTIFKDNIIKDNYSMIGLYDVYGIIKDNIIDITDSTYSISFRSNPIGKISILENIITNVAINVSNVGAGSYGLIEKDERVCNNNTRSWSNTVPSNGTYKTGDIVYNSNPINNIFAWSCIEGGTPGVWKKCVLVNI